MIVRTWASADQVAEAAADWLADRAREAIAERGRFSVAVSGGWTPWAMLRAFVLADLSWDRVHLFQVDERIAPDGHVDRNWTQIADIVGGANDRVRAMELHPMSVGGLVPGADADEARDGGGPLARAAGDYAASLERFLGSPAVLDVVHLGLGTDGHTASLVPGDPILEEARHDVGVTRPYQGRRRLSLTYPPINRARHVLWVVTGAEKREMVARLLASDQRIPAGRVRGTAATLLLDDAAAPTH